MFKLFNKKQHKFASSKFYKIDEVLEQYELFKKNKITEYDGIAFSHTPYMNFLLKLKQKHGEFRCAICGCKANHFRVCYETSNNKLFHLFGINHIKGTKDAEYLFFNKDHICPVSKGGYNGFENLRLTCEKCNTNRGNTTDASEIEAINTSKVIKFKNQIANYLSIAKHNTDSLKEKQNINSILKKIRIMTYEHLKNFFE